MRLRFRSEVSRRLLAFRRALQSLIIGEDAFGLVVNQDQRWRFRTDAEKVEEFRTWIESQLKTDVLGDDKLTSDDWWQKYVEEGYRKGTGRAFDDTKKPALSADDQKSVSDFYRGTKDEFLRSAFARPESVEKVKLLAGRVLTDLKGVTGYMAQQMVRELTDGLAAGENPRTIARRMVKSLGIAKNRATTIARTEIVRAHAEGQLDGLERLGVTEVGVMVEWVTAGDSRVCPQCQPLSGVVLKISEARGSIPRHPNCRCAWVPANVGESKTGQQRGRKAVEQAIDASVKEETGKKGPDASRWTGADTKVSETRPKSVLDVPEKKAPRLPIPVDTVLTFPQVSQVVGDVVKKQKYRGQVNVNNRTNRKFTVAGITFEEGGHCVLATGEVNIWNHEQWKVKDLEGLVSHEVMHGMYEAVWTKYQEERAAIKPEYISANGDLKPEYRGQFPVYESLDKYYRNPKKLEKEDGVTDYSRAYWKDWVVGKTTTHVAVHETLAEVANIHQKLGDISLVSPTYRSLYRTVKKEYKTMTKQQKQKPIQVNNAAADLVASPQFFDARLRPVSPEKSVIVEIWENGKVVRGYRTSPAHNNPID